MKLRALVLLTILIAIPAIAQQTASGHLLTGAGSAAQASAFVRFRLDNYGLNVAKISGSGVLVQPPPDVFPNAVTGLWSTSIYDNDHVSPAGTQWIAEYWWNGQLQYSAPYTLTGGGPYNLDSLAPNYTQPVVPAPTGDSTYARLDDGNTSSWDALMRSLSGAQTTSSSTVSNAEMYFTRTDSSPPVPNAGILNNWLAPMVRFDLISQGGGVTGAHQVMLLNMPNVKGKEYTTLTQSVTGSGTPQTVSVGDSSIWNLTDRNQAFIDFNHGGSSETVTVTAISDATHITGVFTLSHSTGANARNGFAGYKSVFGALGEDQAGSTNNLNVLNPNIVCVAQTAALCVGLEQDVTNSTGVRPALYYGEDSTHRYIVGEEIGIYNGDITAGMVVDSGDGTHAANNGYLCISCGKNNAIAIASSGSVHAANGIMIRDSTNNGIIIGSHQTPPDNPAWGGTDPTHGIYLTAKGSSGSVSSNDLLFEALNAGVSSFMNVSYSAIGGGLYFAYNGATPGPTTNAFIGATDNSVNTPSMFFLRDTSTAQAVASFKSVGNAGFIQPENSHTLAASVTTLNVGSGTTLAKLYVVSGAITPASTAANTCAEQSFTPAAFSGVITAGDSISLTTSATMAANGVFPVLGIRAVTNGVAITYCNVTAGALTAPAVTITVKGTR